VYFNSYCVWVKLLFCLDKDIAVYCTEPPGIVNPWFRTLLLWSSRGVCI
jgi:hypothetical protein